MNKEIKPYVNTHTHTETKKTTEKSKVLVSHSATIAGLFSACVSLTYNYIFINSLKTSLKI